MKRLALLFVLAAVPMFSDSPVAGPTVSCTSLQLNNSISTPAASGAFTSYGILVQAFSPDETVAAYMVTITYADSATMAQKTRTQLFLRVHDYTDQLSETIVWTGQPVVNVSCMVMELKPAQSATAAAQNQ